MELLSADQFSLEELTEAYNESRIDYIVPMPMNVARLEEYIHLYDVDLSASWVAVDGRNKLGLGMLGVRNERAWITRLGVLPDGRRRGTGGALMEHLLQSAADRELDEIWLEVIKDNTPAHKLFLKFGFTETRELLVARRPPTPEIRPPALLKGITISQIGTLQRAETLRRMARRQDRPNWLVQTETMRNVPNLSAFMIETSNGGRGWVSYNASMFLLTRIYVDVLEGDIPSVTAAALLTLHRYNPVQDAIMENMSTDDPRWQGFTAMGYFEAFRRIEMVRPKAASPTG
ncbi:MAG: GNAT family N-acetyltransferase [Candidatus Promineifilaceae bacterium]